jgi:hypothetical protein
MTDVANALPSQPGVLLHSYLFAWLFFLGLSLGSGGLLMLYQLTGGHWMLPLHRYLRAALAPLLALALLFIPVLSGLAYVYPWAHGSHSVADKAWYLNSASFVLRAIIALTLWLILTSGHRRVTGRDPRLNGRSAVGLIVYFVTMTMAAVDWIGSLQSDWYSTGFGLIVTTAQGLGAFAFATSCATLASSRAGNPLGPRACGDLGNLLLAFVMTWMYLAFVQFLIIWAEDLPHETVWYFPRLRTDWLYITLGLFALQFALPFCLLLFRRVTRRPGSLALIALTALAGNLIYVSWLVLPSVNPGGIHYGWTDLVALMAIGGVWAFFFSRDLEKTRPEHWRTAHG